MKRKWLWTRHVEEAWERAEQARRELEQVREQRAEVEAMSGRARRHGELNGWTAAVTTIFSGR